MDPESRPTDKMLETLSRQTSPIRFLPNGFPAYLDSRLSWTTAAQGSDSDCIYQLTELDCHEIDDAFMFFEDLELYGDQVTRDRFPLPTLKYKLHDLATLLNDGPGYLLIRGLDSSKYSVEDITIIWLGIQSYIAEVRLPQDSKNNMLVHMTCNTPPRLSHLAANHVRHTTTDIKFHTDPAGDILAFLTRSNAAYGGECLVSSAYQIYNELAATRPDVLPVLTSADWPFFLPYPHERAILFMDGPKAIFNFNPLGLFGSLAHPRPQTLRPLSSSQLDALHTVQKLARKHSRTLATEAGDMHFVNNLAVLHGREAFEDSEDHFRHIVRMTLRSEDWAWELPIPLLANWFEPIEACDQVWHINPMPFDISDELLKREI